MTEDLEFDEKGAAFASTKDFPRHLVVALVSKSRQDMVDERTFDAGSPYMPPDLTIEEAEQNVANLVRGGESDTIEFKSQIPKSQEAIAIATVAFANRKGGRIFVGVDNDGQIVGCPGANVKDTLTSILRDRCEPPVEFAVAEATVDGKLVYIVTVPEGKDKPYQVKEKGFYLRTGATNRLVTRYELDEIYGSKSESLSLGSSPFD
jgi:ATP-dependent DNA helicase RecG